MKYITLEQIQSWDPCYDPSKVYDFPEGLTILDLLDSDDIPAKDRVWCHRMWLRYVAIPELSDKDKRLFACWCATRALNAVPREKRDPRSLKAILVAKRFAHGKATATELEEAQRAAAAAAARLHESRIHVVKILKMVTG